MLADHQPAHQGDRAKVCSKCHQAKPLDEFWRDTTKRDGRCAACIACRDALYSRGERARAYRAENRETLYARNRVYVVENREAVNARRRAKRAENLEANRARSAAYMREWRKRGAAKATTTT